MTLEELFAKYAHVERKDREFCRQCGATFPPIIGEGACVDWGVCWKGQREAQHG